MLYMGVGDSGTLLKNSHSWDPLSSMHYRFHPRNEVKGHSLGRRSFWQWEWSNEGWTENVEILSGSFIPCVMVLLCMAWSVLREIQRSLFVCLFFGHAMAVDSPHSSVGKESACNAGNPSSIPGIGKICWRRDRLPIPVFLVFPGGSAGKESACNAGDLGSIPGLERSPGEGNSYPLQYSGLENSMGLQRVRYDWSTFTFVLKLMAQTQNIL